MREKHGAEGRTVTLVTRDPETGEKQLVQVPLSGNLYRTGTQKTGFALGATFAISKMITYDILAWGAEKIANSNVGLGAQQGYQSTYYHRDMLLQKSQIKRNSSHESRVTWSKDTLGIDLNGQTEEDVLELVTKARVVKKDLEGKERYPLYHAEPKITSRVEEIKTKRSSTMVGNQIGGAAPAY